VLKRRKVEFFGGDVFIERSTSERSGRLRRCQQWAEIYGDRLITRGTREIYWQYWRFLLLSAGISAKTSSLRDLSRRPATEWREITKITAVVPTTDTSRNLLDGRGVGVHVSAARRVFGPLKSQCTMHLLLCSYPEGSGTLHNNNGDLDRLRNTRRPQTSAKPAHNSLSSAVIGSMKLDAKIGITIACGGKIPLKIPASGAWSGSAPKLNDLLLVRHSTLKNSREFVDNFSSYR